MTDDLRGRLLAYIETHNVATLATTGPDGPWATPVFYASEGFTLYFLSSPRSRHARNLGASPAVSAAITEDYRDWSEIQGIQLAGRAEALPPLAYVQALPLYLRKFPYVQGFLRGEGTFEIAGKALQARLYRLVPERLYLTDNRAHFGRREEFVLAPEG